MERPEVTVFSADDSNQTVMASAREAWKFRSFISYMTRKDLRTTYMQSYLGWMWSLINPIAELIIYSLVFGVILEVRGNLPQAPADFSSFPHYLLAGLVIWNFYKSTSSKILNTFTATVRLRKKLYFPPVAPALSQALTTLIENSLEIFVLILFYVVVGHGSLTAVVVFPVAVIATTYGLGVGLLLSVANTRYRDIGYLYSIFLRLFFYLIPIIWPLEFVDERIEIGFLRTIVRWNPIAKLIEMSRDGLYLHEWPPLTDWAYISVWSVVLVYVGWSVFARTSADAAEGL